MNERESHKVTLKTPLLLADGNSVSEITITEPSAGALKGINRYDLLIMNDEAHKKLLPRISQPCITAQMYEQMSLKDTQKLMNQVVGFFADAEDLAT